MRTASAERSTKETSVQTSINLDGTGISDIHTGIGFFDHMLDLLSFHSKFDIKVHAEGDLNVDDHHTIEDCGIALGNIFKEALGDRKGIERYGSFTLPMDEALATVSIDISGRPFLVFNCEFKREKIGEMSTEMVEEFLRAFAFAAGISLHVNLHYGNNDHHKAEAVFKALGHALKAAVKVTGTEIPSSKGMLE